MNFAASARIALAVAGLSGCGLDAAGTSAGREAVGVQHGPGAGGATSTGATGEGGATSTSTSTPSTGAGGATTTSSTSTGSGGAPGTGGAGGFGPCAGLTATCGESVPAGWQRVGRAAQVGADCGEGLGPIDVDAWPSGAGVCACAPAVETQPTCLGGTVSVSYDSWQDGSCNDGTIQRDASGACMDAGVTLAYHLSASGPVPQGGACTSAGALAPGVAKAPTRLCGASVDACEGRICGEPGFVECVLAPGDVTCPAGPFTARTVLATPGAPDPTCPACTCGAAPSCQGTLTYYYDGGCGQAVIALPADGQCRTNGAHYESYVGSYRYSAVALTNAQPPTPAPGATPSFGAAQTLCCRP